VLIPKGVRHLRVSVRWAARRPPDGAVGCTLMEALAVPLIAPRAVSASHSSRRKPGQRSIGEFRESGRAANQEDNAVTAGWHCQ
jgi:hypothetical protein